MADRKKTGKHHPDTQRDFETGTVNPGPGMAPPHRADDIPAGSMKEEDQDRAQSPQQQAERQTGAKPQKPDRG